MLKFFRGNQPLTAAYLIPLCALGVWVTIQTLGTIENTWGPEISGSLGLPFHLDSWIAAALILVIGSLTNRIFNNHGFHERTSYLSMAILMILLATWPTGVFLGKEMVGVLLIVFIIGQLLNLEPNEENLGISFNIGLFLGVLSIMFPPTAYLVPFLWLAVAGAKNPTPRELALPVLGLLTPWVYVLAVHLIQADASEWIQGLPAMFALNIAKFPEDIWMQSYLISFAVMTLLFYWATLMGLGHTSLKYRRIMRVIFRVSLGMALYLLLFGGEEVVRQSMLILPMSTITVATFSLSRKTGFLSDTYVLVLISLAVIIAWMGF